MYKSYYFIVLLLLLNHLTTDAQTINGTITSFNNVIPFANVSIEGTDKNTKADKYGFFQILDAPLGNQHIIISTKELNRQYFLLDVKKGKNEINCNLIPPSYNLDQVVITGTKTLKKKIDSPVIVNILNNIQLENTQACNLAEGLNYQPGLRIETDCQTCNYTQLRMNGLTGGYSQILINGKSIFSPLIGLYGLEQIPTNMIDKIEIIRGGGSTLYGSSAIGGVVNIITKKPTKSSHKLEYYIGAINHQTKDKILSANATILSKNKKNGASFFMNNRNRMAYDHNGDNFSELPLLRDNSFGTHVFISISKNQNIEFNIGSLHEYRYGGEMINGAAHFALQSEERLHDVILANLDYKINFNKNKSSFNAYIASQKTEREHYTGIRPEINTINDNNHLQNPPYGTSLNSTNQYGIQLNHNFQKLLGNNLITIGAEYLSDNIKDEIATYNYLIEQEVNTFGTFLQSDWELYKKIRLLSGVRFDKHSLITNFIISPRVSILYKIYKNTQFRATYSTGFRAPQAFDTDLHMAFAGGGISRIELDNNLKEEKSKSFNTSINYDKIKNKYIYGITVESFYTRLIDAFYHDPVGEDEFGQIFIKKNGYNATVKGLTIEMRANFNQKIELETGFTYQSSEYDSNVNYSLNLNPRTKFLRTPDKYGYANFNYTTSKNIKISCNLIHTGAMDLIHFAGSPEQNEDEYITTETFNSIGLKATYIQTLNKIDTKFEYSIGAKNITNAYQDDFDTTKNRDSNFVYGPSTPRIIYFQIVLKSI